MDFKGFGYSTALALPLIAQHDCTMPLTIQCCEALYAGPLPIQPRICRPHARKPHTATRAKLCSRSFWFEQRTADLTIAQVVFPHRVASSLVPFMQDRAMINVEALPRTKLRIRISCAKQHAADFASTSSVQSSSTETWGDLSFLPACFGTTRRRAVNLSIPFWAKCLLTIGTRTREDGTSTLHGHPLVVRCVKTRTTTIAWTARPVTAFPR